MKTPARELLFDVLDDIEMVALNGGALFHDFQMALEGFTSVPLEELNKSMERIEFSCGYTARWIQGYVKAPPGSFTRMCEVSHKPVLLFTVPGADYWSKFLIGWQLLGSRMENDFQLLCSRFKRGKFHFVNMCSAVVMPEVFQKAIQGVPQEYIRADVVDFLDMYRPKTRVARYGEYYLMSAEEYLKKWIEEKSS